MEGGRDFLCILLPARFHSSDNNKNVALYRIQCPLHCSCSCVFVFGYFVVVGGGGWGQSYLGSVLQC